MVLLSPCYCWRSWHAKSDWNPISCLSVAPCVLILSSGLIIGFGHFSPRLSFFRTKMKHKLRTLWFWQNCTALNQWNLLIIIQWGKVFWYLLFLILRSWNCWSDNQSMVPDTSFIIIQRGKTKARKSILLIIRMCSKRDGSNLCPFILYFQTDSKTAKTFTVWNILCQIVMAYSCQ